MLQYAVKQAMKEKAARIYLTATPDETWKRKLKQGKQKVLLFLDDIIVILCQFLYFVGAGIGKNLIHKRIPRVLLQWLQTYLNKNSLFFIRPHVRYIEEISLLLKPLNNRIEGVHAEDPGEKKVAAFRKEKSHY